MATVKVKLLRPMAVRNRVLGVGEVIEVPIEAARVYVSHGVADLAKGESLPYEPSPPAPEKPKPPAGWRDLHRLKRVRIASDLSGREVTSVEEADAFLDGLEGTPEANDEALKPKRRRKS